MKSHGETISIRDACDAVQSSVDDPLLVGRQLIELVLDATPEEFRGALQAMQDRIEAARVPGAQPVDSHQVLVDVMNHLHRNVLPPGH